jgi:hypothetical protein
MKTNVYFQVGAPLVVGFVIYNIQNSDLEERTQQQLLHYQLEKSMQTESQRKGSEETKNALKKMLKGENGS